jgi:hypothetical protein
MKYGCLGVRHPKTAAEQGISNFSRMPKPMIIIGEDSFTVAPTQVVKILAHTLGEYDSISPLHQRFLFCPGGSACYYDVKIGINTWVKRKDHRLSPSFDSGCGTLNMDLEC